MHARNHRLPLVSTAVVRQLKNEALRRRELEKDLKSCKQHYRSLLNRSNEMIKQSQRFSQLLLLEQEEDRKEISRELHDEVGQVLAGVNFQLAILSKEASKGSQRLREKIQQAQGLIEISVETIHRFAQELRPMILDDLGLVEATRSYGKEFTKQTAIKVEINVPAAQPE